MNKKRKEHPVKIVMMKKVLCLSAIPGILLLGGRMVGAAERPLKVVATLPTFADLVKTVGGAHVEVASIASPKFNPHFIEPKPSDVLKVKRADLFVHAGLDLELWRGPLLDAAGKTTLFPGQPGELDLSQGIALLEVPTRTVSRSEGDIHLYGNPHYWVDPENAKIMARTIAQKLSEVDAVHAPDYRKNLEGFLARLDEQIQTWHARLASFKEQECIGYHNEWPYLMRFAGLRMERFLEPKPGIPPTPKQLEFLEQYGKERHIRAIVQSTYFPMEASISLAKRTGAQVVLLCQSVGEAPACSDYVAMLDYDVTQLAEVLGS
ncbi:MAG: zinc ABC transporter substrate-binding protein [Candidatus Omnitrophica bacterium]|nr:zinc ABC transporter substrate-binding protein [Candidatus Omnitrophota bacterium]